MPEHGAASELIPVPDHFPETRPDEGHHCSPLQLGDNDTDPEFNKKIHAVILRDRTFIVYLDDALTTYWWYTSEYQKPETGAMGRVLNRVASLESIPISFLSKPNRVAFRRLVAEGVARIMDEKSEESAMAVLDQAEHFVQSRSAEVARGWFVMTGIVALFMFGAVVGVFHASTPVADPMQLSGAQLFVDAIGLGAIGACLSLVSRLNKVFLDPAAGFRLHVLECCARLSAGMIGALLVVLAIKAGFLLPSLDADARGRYALFAMCLAAGASERLVPSLIGKIEASTADSPVAAKPGE